MEWYEIVISILSGLVALIPLVIKLVEYVEKATKEKNWQALLELVMKYMQEAEGKFATGTERKEFVLMAIKASAGTLNYDIDLDVVSDMIDALAAMSKVVNAPKVEAEPEIIEVV